MTQLHPLVTQPAGATVILPPRLLPPAAYYAILASYPRAIIDWSGPYDRSLKATHRFDIADTRGRLTLTVPIAKPDHRVSWAEVTLSDHGRWQETMPTALESAYGRTPFFEFYADRLLPIIAGAQGGMRLIDFAAALDAAIRAILGLPPDAVTFADTPDSLLPSASNRVRPSASRGVASGTPASASSRPCSQCVNSLTQSTHPLDCSQCDDSLTTSGHRFVSEEQNSSTLWPDVGPYWQIRADRFGFIPRLSILDLIFNLGPEAPLHLRCK